MCLDESVSTSIVNGGAEVLELHTPIKRVFVVFCE
jgi:hypothetical protein